MGVEKVEVPAPVVTYAAPAVHHIAAAPAAVHYAAPAVVHHQVPITYTHHVPVTSTHAETIPLGVQRRVVTTHHVHGLTGAVIAAPAVVEAAPVVEAAAEEAVVEA